MSIWTLSDFKHEKQQKIATDAKLLTALRLSEEKEETEWEPFWQTFLTTKDNVSHWFHFRSIHSKLQVRSIFTFHCDGEKGEIWMDGGETSGIIERMCWTHHNKTRIISHYG